MKKATKTDEFLKQLEDIMPKYIKAVGSFQCKNETYTLAGHFTAEDYLTCQICGRERIIDVYVIKDSHGHKLNVGNVCISRISNQKIGKWFKNWESRKKNIETCRPMIDAVDMIISQYENDTLPISISEIGIERLRKMLERMGSGIKPLDKTVKLANYYITKMLEERKRRLQA